jgi:hypothetical protein
MVLLQLSCCWVAVIITFVNSANAADICGALSVAKIAGELGGVDWKTLAGWLDVQHGKVDGIEAKCLRDGGELAECYRINLVRTFCESEGVTAEVAGEKIANALQKMGKNLQASNIRQLELGQEKIKKPSADEQRAINLGENEASIQDGVKTGVAEGTCPRNDPECGRFNWKDEEPLEKELEFFKYRDSNGDVKKFRPLQLIQQKCREIGTQLGINKATLSGYERRHSGEPIDLCLEVFNYWSASGSDDYPYTWGSIVEMLEDVQLKGIATKLENALSSKK